MADLFKELTLNSLLLTYGQWQVRLQFIWGVWLKCVMMGMTCTQQEWHEPIQGNWIAYKEDAPKKEGTGKKSRACIWNIPLVNFKRLEHVLRKSGLAFKKQDPFIVWGESHRRLKDAGWDLLWIPWFSKSEAQSQIQTLPTTWTMTRVKRFL